MRNIKDTWLKRRRDRDLFEKYACALSSKTFKTQKEAVDYVRLHPAPRFYISAQAASAYINALLSGNSVDGLSSSSLRRLKELYRRFNEMRKEDNAKRMSVFSLCQIIVEQDAPEFYIGYDHASKIICRESSKHNDRMARRNRV